MRPIHFLTPFALTATAFASGGIDATLNEVRVDNSGTDVDEFFELTGTPGTSLAGVWLVVIGDGSGGSGTVERGLDLSAMSIQADGYLSVGHMTMTVGTPDELLSPTSNFFENSDNLTFLLVDAFTGSAGDDLDTDDDGVLDSTPWTSIYDEVSFVENFDTPGSGEFFYSTTTVGPDGTFAVAHASRCPDGPTGVWTVQPFATGPNDTPGAANDCTPVNSSCATPATADVGTLSFDNTFATDSGNSFCGEANIGGDLFYVFSVPSDGDYTADTCGSSFDTAMSVGLGADCSATCVGDNDDSCGTQSSVSITGALTGEDYIIRVGGWQTGTVGSGVLNITASTPPPPPPANDTCATPDVAVLGANAFDSTTATNSGVGACSAGIGNDVFFVYTVAVDGDYTFDSCGSSFDTELSVGLGTDCTATCIGVNDDGGPCSPQSTVDVAGALSGESYIVRIGGWNPDTGVGPGVLNVSVTIPPPPAPANDTCATPDVAVLGANAFDSSTATDSGVGACAAVIGADLFWTYTIAADGDYTFDSCGSSFDSELSVGLGADCSATCVAVNDDGGPCSPQSTVDVVGALVGEVYIVRVGGWNAGTGGVGVLNVSVTIPPPPPPANDTCATPDVAVLGANAYDNTNATSTAFDGGGPCSAAIGQDLFYTFTAGSDDLFQFDLCAAANDTRIAIHNGADCAAVCIGDNDDSCTLQSSIQHNMLTGETVLVQVGGFGASTGAGDLTISIATPPPPPPANNDCSTPDAIAAEGTYAFNNEFATTSGFDGGDPVLCMSPLNGQNTTFGASSKDLFWAFSVPCDGDYTFDTAGSPVVVDTRLSLHLGADCTATCITSNDDIDTGGGNYLSTVTLTGLVAGDAYLVQVGLWNEAQISGDGVLNIARAGGACPTYNVLCDPANNHNQGSAVTLAGSTFGSGVGSGLHLDAAGGPTLGTVASWGFFLVSVGGSASDPLGNGIMCLDAPQARYSAQTAMTQGIPALNSIGRFDVAGDLENFAGTSTTGYGYDVPNELPFSPAGSLIVPGDTYYYQLWYRDLASSNLSNMLEVTF